MVALKRDFVEYFQSLRQNNNCLSAIERFSDKYQMISSELKESSDSQIYWDALPAELHPNWKKALKRKSRMQSCTEPKKSNIDISSR